MKRGKGKQSVGFKSRRRDRGLVFVCAFIVVALIFVAFLLLDGANTNMKFRDRHRKYGDGWELISDGEKTIIDLPYVVSTDSNGEVIIRKTLPENIPKNYAMITRNYHQILEIRINGVLRYRYPDVTRPSYINIITDDWHMINLTTLDSRKIIDFKF